MPIDIIITTEGRQLFVAAIEEIREKYAQNAKATTTDEAVTVAKKIGYPIIMTLSDVDYNMLRTIAIDVIRHFGVVGKCNIQYALNPASWEYCIIEVHLFTTQPSLDCIFVKIPRWDLKKFNCVSRLLSSRVKSVSEVMSIGKTFEETIQNTICSIDDQFATRFAKAYCFGIDFVNDINERLLNLIDKHLFAISTASHHGYWVEKIW
ncbi:hypothetical protein OF83DRAFT_1089530 [Amylostereum chailletii]|nr:hypothetical protein OF83DRAFT_1089530 [Amylostereum chailletii]